MRYIPAFFVGISSFLIQHTSSTYLPDEGTSNGWNRNVGLGAERVVSDHTQLRRTASSNRKLSLALELPRYYLRIVFDDELTEDIGDLLPELETILSNFFYSTTHTQDGTTLKHLYISCVASHNHISYNLSRSYEDTSFKSYTNDAIDVILQFNTSIVYESKTGSSYDDLTSMVNDAVHDALMTEHGKDHLIDHIASRSNHSSFQRISRLLADEEDSNAETEKDNEQESEEADEAKGSNHRLLSMMFGISLIVIAGTSLGGWAYILYMRCEYRKERQREEKENGNANTKESGDKSLCWKSNQNNGDVVTIIGSSVLERSPNSDKNAWGSTIISFDYSIEDLNSTDEDSFGKELQTAARFDQHSWQTADAMRKSVEARKKRVPRLQPPSRDVTHVHPTSIPPARYEHINHQSSIISNREQMYTPYQYRYDITTITPDPEDVVASGDSSASDTSESFTGKDSSVEEGDRSSMGNISVYTDEMNAHLLSSRTSINGSMDIESGMGFSQRSDSESGIHGGRQGFHVIQSSTSMEERYIPRDEYEAAVGAAQAALAQMQQQQQHSLLSTSTEEALKLSISAPSDELHGNFTPPKGKVKSDTIPRFDDSDPGGCSTSVSTASFSTALQSIGKNSTKEGESLLSTDVFKELKNISVFLKRYEKKKSMKERKSQRASSNGAWGSILDSDDDATDYGSNVSLDTSTIDSSRPSLQSENELNDRKRLFRRPSFAKKKHPDAESLTKLEAKINSNSQTKEARARNLPPLYPEQQEQSQELLSTPSPKKRPSFPVPLPSSLEASKAQPDVDQEVVSNLALDKLLQEDPSFDISMMKSNKSPEKERNHLSSTIETEEKDSVKRMGITPPSSSSGQKPIFSINKLIDRNRSSRDENVSNMVKGEYSRRALDTGGERRILDALATDKSRAQSSSDDNYSMHKKVSSKEDTGNNEDSDSLPPNRFQQRLDIAADQEAETSIPKKLSATEITKNALESGARTIRSMIESKLPRYQSGATIGSKEKEPSSSIGSAKSEEPSITEQHNDTPNVISPTSLSTRRPQPYHAPVDTTDDMRQSVEPTSSAPIVSPSPTKDSKSQSNARNLISMFESNVNRAAKSSGIFPQSEYWQYTGKLRRQHSQSSYSIDEPIS